MNGEQAASRFTLEPLDAQAASLALFGHWRLTDGIPDPADVEIALAGMGELAQLGLRDAGIVAWDGSLLAFLLPIIAACRKRGVAIEPISLPPGLSRLIALAEAVPEHAETARPEARPGLARRSINRLRAGMEATRSVVAFLGDLLVAFAMAWRRRRQFPGGDFLVEIEQCGAQALPIVGIIAFLVGLIMGFVGAMQLMRFGAGIYLANLVGLAMTREMAPLMTAIVLSGRTGAAFAAELGAMQSNEEVDALTVLGIPAIRHLVLPRVLALALMTPLLCLYADLLGILGGLAVGHGIVGLSGTAFLEQLESSHLFPQFVIGIAKSAIFGVIVAVAGCYQGLHSGRSAAEVGQATTRAVVFAILYVIVADGVLTVVLQGLNL
jgi:phospholipid/cholesterol/gamma-HCH transport system permease protein